MNTLYYFIKIAQKKKIMIIVYLAIITVFSGLSADVHEDRYAKTTLNIGIVKNEESTFSNSLVEYLGKDNTIYYYDSLQMAELDLYTAFIDGIIEIPAGAEKLLLETDSPSLKIVTDMSNSQSIFIQRIANKHSLYYKAMVDAGELDLQKLSKVLDEKTEVVFAVKQSNVEKSFYGFAGVYSFVVMMILIKLLGDLNISFNKKNIQIRNHISSKSSYRLKGELVLAQIMIAVLTFMVVNGIFLFVMYPEMLKSETLSFYLLTIFLWTMVVALLSNLINQILKTKTLNEMVGNVLPLILAFISGSTLPLEFMPDFVQNIAKFSPLFYYNKAIMKISESNFNISDELMIITAFGIAFFLVSLYLTKERKTKTV